MHRIIPAIVIMAFLSAALRCQAGSLPDAYGSQPSGDVDLLPPGQIPYSSTGGDEAYMPAPGSASGQSPYAGQSLKHGVIENQFQDQAYAMPAGQLPPGSYAPASQESFDQGGFGQYTPQQQAAGKPARGTKQQDLNGHVSKSDKGSKMGKALGAIGKGLLSTAEVALPAAAMVGSAYLMSRAYSNSGYNSYYGYPYGSPYGGGAYGYPAGYGAPYGMYAGGYGAPYGYPAPAGYPGVFPGSGMFIP